MRRSRGAVAQLGERRVRNAKVGSSILLRSTNRFQTESLGKQAFPGLFLLPQRTRVPSPDWEQAETFPRLNRALVCPRDVALSVLIEGRNVNRPVSCRRLRAIRHGYDRGIHARSEREHGLPQARRRVMFNLQSEQLALLHSTTRFNEKGRLAGAAFFVAVREGQRQTRTGNLEPSRTRWVSLPSSSRSKPRRPCEAMTIRSQPRSSAMAAMTLAGWSSKV